MPVIIQDTAVVSQGFCAPISSPASPVLGPAEINTQAASQIASARFISTEEAAAIAAPSVIDFTPASEPAAPFIVPSVSATAIDAPFLVPFVSASTIAAPIVLLTVAASDVSAPVLLPFVAATPVAAPNVITPNAYSDQPPFPLTHPRILYQSKIAGSTSTGDGTNRVGLLNPSTWDRWTFTASSGATLTATFTLPANQDIDSIAIAAHNLADTGSNVRFDYAATVGGAWVQFAAGVVPTNNNAIMVNMASSVSVAQVRVVIFGGTGAGYIGVLYAGEALQMQRAIYGGVNPITLNRVTDYFSNKSEAGEWLGRQVRRRGLESSLNFDRLTAPWYRQYFDPFVRSAITTPFFFAWRPADYPNDVAYCWTESDIQPSNSGGATNHMAVQFSVKAHA